MPTKIFVNLPVRDIAKSTEFFGKLGFAPNLQYTDETSACVAVSRNIYVMLLTEAKFRSLTPKVVCDATRNTEVLVSLSCDNRQEVDELVRKAVAAGGTACLQPPEQGIRYEHGFQDLDGHIWELTCLDGVGSPGSEDPGMASLLRLP